MTVTGDHRGFSNDENVPDRMLWNLDKRLDGACPFAAEAAPTALIDALREIGLARFSEAAMARSCDGETVGAALAAIVFCWIWQRSKTQNKSRLKPLLRP